MGTAWKMPIAVIGKPTGDGRQFDDGALSHRDLPLPLRYVATDSGGHNNAVIVGHINKIGKAKDGMLPAAGEFYDDESWPDEVRHAATAAMKFTSNKVIGPSVDLDQMEAESVPEPKAHAAWVKAEKGKLKAAKQAYADKKGTDCGCGGGLAAEESHYDGPRLRLVKSGRIASATLVHIPAFAELAGHAKLIPIDDHDPNVETVTAAADSFWDDVEWADKIENDPELPADEEGSGIWLTDDDFAKFAKKKLPSKSNKTEGGPDYPSGDGQGSGGGQPFRGESDYAPGGPDVTKTDVRKKLDDADFVDPKGRRFPIASCSDIADAVSSYGRANPKIPYGQFKSRLMAIAKRKGCEGSLPDNWKAADKMASLMAGAAPVAPPSAWFDDPHLGAPTPLHIDDDGRVYGHVAVWDTCHVGIGDSCVTPPKSLTSYAYFHTGEVKTAEGSRVAVGRLTYGGGHAAPNLGYRAAAEHYDRTSNTGAYVRAGEDDYGIWVAGMLAPDADESAVFKMRAAPLSGDWRRVGTNLEMVAALHVNTAGFPIPRAMVTASAGHEEETLSLVAAGALPTALTTDLEPSALGPLDTAELGRAIARGMLAEQRSQAETERKQAEWQQLIAAATTDDLTADYHEAMSGLLVALVEE